MADRRFEGLEALQRELKILTGKVSLDTDASVLAKSGDFESVVKSGTGEYTIKLADQYASFALVVPSVVGAVGVGVQVSSYNSMTKTIVVKTTAISEGAIVAANVDSAVEIGLLVIAKNA